MMDLAWMISLSFMLRTAIKAAHHASNRVAMITGDGVRSFPQQLVHVNHVELIKDGLHRPSGSMSVYIKD